MKPAAVAVALAGLVGLGIFLLQMEPSSVHRSGESPEGKTNGAARQQGQQAQQVRGAYLTQAGNCRGCHTAKGG